MLTFLLGMTVMLAGCGVSISSELTGDKPPETKIQIGDRIYPTVLGTYCWSSKLKSECVDTAGPEGLLEGKVPIAVESGEEVELVMNYEPLPNEIHLSQMISDIETKVEVENHRFTAPTEQGVYYYYYGVWWMDETEENVSNGDAFYAFALEVK